MALPDKRYESQRIQIKIHPPTPSTTQNRPLVQEILSIHHKTALAFGILSFIFSFFSLFIFPFLAFIGLIFSIGGTRITHSACRSGQEIVGVYALNHLATILSSILSILTLLTYLGWTFPI